MSDSTKNIIKAPPFAAVFRKWWVDNREWASEWYRAYFHTIFVTIMLVVNLFFAYSAGIIYLSRWKHAQGSAEVVLSFIFDRPPAALSNVMNFFFIPFDTWHWGWMILVFNLPLLNWFYSTITQPIKKGFKTIISWTSERGRIWACILSAIPFIAIYCALIAWYVDVYLFDTFASINSDKSHLVVKSMASFGYILMALPVFISVVGTYLVMKQFYVFEDLQQQFMTWEFPLLSRQSFSLKNDRCDVIVGWEKKTKKPIVLSEGSRFLHELIAGSTGTGKTSTTILMRITQDLIRIARGHKVSVVALEPKGDMVRDVLKIAKKLGVPEEKIKVVDPTDLAHSIKFNPFIGPMEAAAEAFRGVLNALTGDQDEFFKGQQEETASLYTLLGKLRYGNLFNIHHIQRMYSDPRYLATITEEVRLQIEKGKKKPDLTDEEKVAYERYERIVSYFEDEVLEYKTWKNKEGEILPVTYSENHRYAGQQIVENKKDKFVSGAKKYLNDLSMNQMLSSLMVANDGDAVLDIDKFLEEGGILLVNSALGELEELSILLGQFFIRQFQSSVFRRPPEGGMKRIEDGSIMVDDNDNPILHERIPTFFYIDEFPLYVNESFERMLTLGRSYKVGSLIAIQSLGQLQKVIPGYDQVILGNARNKTVFGGGQFADNEAFSNQFGEEYQIEESLNESSTPVTMPGQRWDYRYNTQRKLMARFSPTDIMELKFKHFICQFVSPEGSIQPPVEGIGKFVNETKFLKKFVDIGKIELETKNYKPLNIGAHLRFYQSLIVSSFSKSGEEEAAAGVSDEANQESAQVEGTTGQEQETQFRAKKKTNVSENTSVGASPSHSTKSIDVNDDDATEVGNTSEEHNNPDQGSANVENSTDGQENQEEKTPPENNPPQGSAGEGSEATEYVVMVVEDVEPPALAEQNEMPSAIADLANTDDDDEEGETLSSSFTPKSKSAGQQTPEQASPITASSNTDAQVSTLDAGLEKNIEELLNKVQEHSLEKSSQGDQQRTAEVQEEQVEQGFDWTTDDIPDPIEEEVKQSFSQKTRAQQKVQLITGEEEDDL